MPNKIVIHRETIVIDRRIPDLKIAILTDIHLSRTKVSKLKMLESIEKINIEKPDLIFLLGDFMSDFYYYYHFLNNLRDLKSKHGVFAVLGNHDYGLLVKKMKNKTHRAEKILEVLKNNKIKIIINKQKIITIQNQKIAIIGVDDYWSDDFSLDIMKASSKKIPTILLSHNPDAVLDLHEDHFTDLIVSGHTHGYSIRLPKIGPITTAGITRLGRRYDKGVKSFKGRMMYICSGIGTSTRLYNPPQISILSITQKKSG